MSSVNIHKLEKSRNRNQNAATIEIASGILFSSLAPGNQTRDDRAYRSLPRKRSRLTTTIVPGKHSNLKERMSENPLHDDMMRTRTNMNSVVGPGAYEMPKLMGSIVLESPLRNVPKFSFGKRVNNVITKFHVQVRISLSVLCTYCLLLLNRNISGRTLLVFGATNHARRLV